MYIGCRTRKGFNISNLHLCVGNDVGRVCPQMLICHFCITKGGADPRFVQHFDINTKETVPFYFTFFSWQAFCLSTQQFYCQSNQRKVGKEETGTSMEEQANSCNHTNTRRACGSNKETTKTRDDCRARKGKWRRGRRRESAVLCHGWMRANTTAIQCVFFSQSACS